MEEIKRIWKECEEILATSSVQAKRESAMINAYEEISRELLEIFYGVKEK